MPTGGKRRRRMVGEAVKMPKSNVTPPAKMGTVVPVTNPQMPTKALVKPTRSLQTNKTTKKAKNQKPRRRY